MISVNLSIDQLIETIKGLNEDEKIQIKSALNDNDLYISEEQMADLVQRKQDLLDGKISSRSWEEIEKHYESIQH
jgi:hypothetical protein